MPRPTRLMIGLLPVPDRQEFVDMPRRRIMEFFTEWGRSDANGLTMWFGEMIENIYDHAGGSGSLVIRKIHGRGFEFEVQDNGGGQHDFQALVGQSTKFGLQTIQELAPTLGITLNVDTQNGFTYKGTIAGN